MAAGNTIGQAYVQILPSMNGFSKAMNAQGGAAMDSAGGNAGKRLTDCPECPQNTQGGEQPRH